MATYAVTSGLVRGAELVPHFRAFHNIAAPYVHADMAAALDLIGCSTELDRLG